MDNKTGLWDTTVVVEKVRNHGRFYKVSEVETGKVKLRNRKHLKSLEKARRLTASNDVRKRTGRMAETNIDLRTMYPPSVVPQQPTSSHWDQTWDHFRVHNHDYRVPKSQRGK